MGCDYLLENDASLENDERVEQRQLQFKQVISRLFERLWYSQGDLLDDVGAGADAGAGASPEILECMAIYNQIKQTVVGLYKTSNAMTGVLRANDPAWSIVCFVGPVEDLPALLRDNVPGGALNEPLFNTKREAICWWLGVRKRELENERRQVTYRLRYVQQRLDYLNQGGVWRRTHANTASCLRQEIDQLQGRRNEIEETLAVPGPEAEPEPEHEHEPEPEPEHGGCVIITQFESESEDEDDPWDDM